MLGRLLKWMESCFVERHMTTVIRVKLTSWKNVINGVAQGSVLSPVVFLMDVKDMSDGLRNNKDVYSDDTKITEEISADCC